jgi:prolyl-tRNA editing enzyme YbaK/EbsC (Cys-tRNA(Pro) deacylase)
MTSVLQRILDLLDERGVPYRHLHHEPTPTSADSARVRGEPLAIGGKAIVLKADGRYHLLVISAARRLESALARRALGARKTRFATREELHELTGLAPGGVPPFGEPILPLPLHVDRSVLANERIAFNAGSLTDSIILSVTDYLAVAGVDADEAVELSGPPTP